MKIIKSNMCKNLISSTDLKDLLLNKTDSIDIRDCYVKTGIEKILSTLDSELVGLKNVKTRVREISSVLLFDRIREIQELGALNSSLHMSFTGRPGTGKTSVANKIALVLRNLGYLTKGHLTNVTREDLVGQYVGHTAPKTREQLKRAQGGILFIDEAHHLYKPDNERDYGSEAVELLLQVMENQRDDLILIFAGQKEKLETFYNCNPGVSSRIGNHVNFEDYNVKELTEITSFILNNEKRYKLSSDTLEVLVHYIEQLVKFPTFANVRTIKIFLNQLLSYQAIRIEEALTQTGLLTYQSLTSITKEDFNYFTKDDFINIIGSENVELYLKN
jgi:probable Rubsico expression protein CbbX|uniref:Putative rubisco expression protein CfxQ n=1 Tax=Synura petersenii TaxID=52555 RepID=A0A0K1IJA2_9STRA|nr:putative rubisco expression protein CfxQ [Synura petersenii]